MFLKIQNAFDSHCHFLGTGQIAAGLSLRNLKSADEVKNLKIEAHHYQQQWLVGFGWDQNKWTDSSFPIASQLDAYFPNTPVFFSRNDGHCSWINSAAITELKKMGYDFSKDPAGGKIQRDSKGNPTGVLFDQAHIQALIKLPYFSSDQQIQFIKIAQKIFNQGGFTHVRDLSMTTDLWKLLITMAKKKELTVCIEGFVTIENLNDLQRVLKDISWMRENSNSLLRIQGVKIFLDGSLGSKTAYISQNYLNTSENGILCWDLSKVKQVIVETWKNGLDLAVHTIGDEAVHQMVALARAVSAQGQLGRLHLEHVQIIRQETIQMMKPLHVTCHMQPCHWLSDHSWLSEVITADVLKNTFQWEALRKNKINIQFGSDSPIETPSLVRTLQALNESSKKGWPALVDDWKKYHSYPDKNWTSSFTEFTDEKIHQVYFQGEPLL
ncbi:MAG: amidohydrolase family protein [Pseudobdellovibrio sp.]